MGVNVGRLYFFVFGVTGVLAGLAGGIGAPFLGAFQGAQFEVLLSGSWWRWWADWGASQEPFVAALLIGIIDSVGKGLFPELAHSPCLPR